MRYEQHVETFVRRVKRDVGTDTIDWIDASDEVTENLEHVDDNMLNRAMFEVDVGVSVEGLSEEQVESVHTTFERIANDEGVSVDVVEANPSSSVYRFWLHASFLETDR